MDRYATLTEKWSKAKNLDVDVIFLDFKINSFDQGIYFQIHTIPKMNCSVSFQHAVFELYRPYGPLKCLF